MDDKTAIQASYASVLDKLFERLFENFSMSGGDAAIQAQAVAGFKAGLANARKARDAAIAAL